MGTHAVSNLIREGKTFQIPSIMSTAKKDGMVSLNDSLIRLAKDGTISPEEAFMKAVDKSSMRSAIERAGLRLSL